jgi:hypothetical protein
MVHNVKRPAKRNGVHWRMAIAHLIVLTRPFSAVDANLDAPDPELLDDELVVGIGPLRRSHESEQKVR